MKKNLVEWISFIKSKITYYEWKLNIDDGDVNAN
jgi:hypothetical protein